jgi:hypothetical protein
MFEIGDEIVCIDTQAERGWQNFGDYSSLTYGKEYYVVNYFPAWKGIRVVNDENKPRDYFADRFIKVSEYRRIKLEKICSHLVK